MPHMCVYIDINIKRCMYRYIKGENFEWVVLIEDKTMEKITRVGDRLDL